MTPINRSAKKLVYMDHAATTPVRPEVVRAMAPFWSKEFGNPSAIYKLGLKAQEALRSSRSSVASILSCRPEEIIFTAGGSESINLAILGAARAYREIHPLRLTLGKGERKSGHIITSSIEHHAVLRAVDRLKKEGFAVTKIGVDNNGFFKLDELKKAIRSDTFLVSLMYANNEIGTIEPIAEIGKFIRAENAKRAKLPTTDYRLPATSILFHTDACQAAGYLDINIHTLGVDLLTLNGSKIYGPKQTGCLYIRKGITLEPLVYGGGQERNMRSGTENVAGIIGFTKALTLAQKERASETIRLEKLSRALITNLLKQIPNAKLNGPPRLRLPNNVNISFKGADGEALVLYLDARNIAAATGSACTSQSSDPSHVLEAIGLQKSYINGSIRFTLGRQTTGSEIAYVAKVMQKLVAQQRTVINTLQ